MLEECFDAAFHNAALQAVPCVQLQSITVVCKCVQVLEKHDA